MRTLGWKKSKIDSSIKIYEDTSKNDLDIYNRTATMPVVDQGQEGSCVSQTIYELYGFYCKNILNKENDINPTYVYYKRDNKNEEGMTCRNAFEILQGEGKIGSFAKINNLESVKHAVLTNGGVLLAVKVYDSSKNDFWEGRKLEGGHAICLLGFDKDYLYFKNSWGNSYGKNGRWKFPIKEFNNKVYEAWTITS